MIDDQPSWARYEHKPLPEARRPDRHWQELGITPMPDGQGEVRSTLDVLIDAEAERRGEAFCRRHAADIARLQGSLSRDARRRLVRKLLAELEREHLLNAWLAEVLRTHGINTRTWTRSRN